MLVSCGSEIATGMLFSFLMDSLPLGFRFPMASLPSPQPAQLRTLSPVTTHTPVAASLGMSSYSHRMNEGESDWVSAWQRSVHKSHCWIRSPLIHSLLLSRLRLYFLSAPHIMDNTACEDFSTFFILQGKNTIFLFLLWWWLFPSHIQEQSLCHWNVAFESGSRPIREEIT